ncbi:SurA N-terminal domain-containing protein [Aquibacillus sediminis]|uniref:SurA N-terminal domain-containing protein n=1 Tax=Aquibacillus sediminis TaxID=2574734 RepID=UPI0014863526|nr:SurA N-terminal domain-containing protein [Aquibacillus sediminis]
MKKVLLIALLGLSMFLVACSDNENTAEEPEQETGETEQETNETEQETTEEDQESEETDSEPAGSQEVNIEEVVANVQVEEDTVVANVNGKEITGQKFNMLLNQTVSMLQQYGQDASDEDLVKQQTLDAAVSQEVLSQELDNQGIEVSSDDVEAQIDQLKQNFETDEQFQEYISQMSLTEEGLQQQMAYEMKVQQYQDAELDVEVTDEEVEEMYDQLSSQNEEVPELSELRPTIEEQLENQKKNSQLTQRIQELQENAEIETLI